VWSRATRSKTCTAAPVRIIRHAQFHLQVEHLRIRGDLVVRLLNKRPTRLAERQLRFGGEHAGDPSAGDIATPAPPPLPFARQPSRVAPRPESCRSRARLDAQQPIRRLVQPASGSTASSEAKAARTSLACVSAVGAGPRFSRLRGRRLMITAIA
jgi:hypothetical protein